MKKLLVLMTFIVSLMIAPVMAAEITTSTVKKLTTETSAYAGKKDKAYWTRVWYRKQAAKGIYYKNGKKKTRRIKRSSKKRYTKKRNRVARVSTKRRIKRKGIVAKVNLSTQRMNVYKNGVHQYTWKISSGRKGYRTPTGSWRVGTMRKMHYSSIWNNAPMPYSMFYKGGFAIHGTSAVNKLGGTASGGCVRLRTANAKKLFSLMRKHGRGRVVVSY